MDIYSTFCSASSLSCFNNNYFIILMRWRFRVYFRDGEVIDLDLDKSIGNF